MQLSLFDWAACTIAGRDEPVARIVRDLALEEAGRAEASVAGTARRLPARAAALVNGTVSHALDYDDTHFAHIGHPSVAVIPAALAVAERTGAEAEAFVDAALVGAEASIRVGVWLGRGHYETGFHQTATAGAFGATVAAARLLRLGPDRAAHALGLAATRAAGLKSQFGTMGKPWNAGIAASTGVEAALLAARGFVSRPDGLECTQGFGRTHAGAGDVLAFEGLGERWMLEGISHKFHACCHGTHAALEALAAFRGIAPVRIDEIGIAVHPRWLSVCDIAAPATGLEAKFSYRLTAAMVLSGHDTARRESFSDAAAADPALVALRDRVRVEGRLAVPETAAEVSLRLADGATRRAAHDLALPPPPAVLEGKLRAKAAALLGAAPSETLAAVALGGPDLAGISALLRGAAPPAA